MYGTDVYLDDSGICLAAIHAGLITPAGGTVTIEIRPGQASYVGSTRNGVTSSTAGQYPGSFVFIREGGSAGLGFLRTPINIAGTWNSSLGLVYEITQSGSNFSWRVTNNAAYNETAHGEFLERDKIKATWTNNNGTDSGQAQVTDVDANGRAKRITWANRVVFTRN